MAKFRAAFNRIEQKLYRAHRETIKRFAGDLYKECLDLMARGESPVAGKSWRAYSGIYKRKIRTEKYYRDLGKKTTPVNLHLTGDTIKSLKVRPTKSGFTTWFQSPLADIHNRRGAGSGKVVRRMLPKRGERFKKVIIDKLKARYSRLVKVLMRKAG